MIAKKVSVVITVYNKAAYIQKCLDSCIHQEDVLDDKYEIVIVNDGSTDNSLELIDQYKRKYPCITILNQKNQGLSMARNNGTKVARGEYVWYVDADDTITPYSIKKIVEATSDYPDVIPIYAKTEGVPITRNKISPGIKTGQGLLKSNDWSFCAPFFVYRKAFLDDNKLEFFPGIYHEDAEFTPRMLYYAKTVKVIDTILYNVYRDPESITQVPKAKRAYDYVIVSDHLYSFMQIHKDDVDQEVYASFCRMVAICVNNALGIICEFETDEKKKFNMFLYEYRKLFKMFKFAPLKYRVEMILFYLFTRQYTSVYNILMKFNRVNIG